MHETSLVKWANLEGIVINSDVLACQCNNIMSEISKRPLNGVSLSGRWYIMMFTHIKEVFTASKGAMLSKRFAVFNRMIEV